MICPYICEKTIYINNNEYNEEQINTANTQTSINIMMQCKQEKCVVWDKENQKCKYKE